MCLCVVQRNVLINLVGTLPVGWTADASGPGSPVHASALSPTSATAAAAGGAGAGAGAGQSSTGSSASLQLTALVADFGLSRVDVTESDASLSAPTTASASAAAVSSEHLPIRWCAPESLTKRRFDVKTDVWGFAVTCYELLSHGLTPYHTSSMAQVSAGVAQHTLSLAPELKHMQLPAALYELLARCLAPNPSLRPDFTEITLALQSILLTV